MKLAGSDPQDHRGKGMKPAAIVLLAWGVWLGVLTSVQAVFEPKLIQIGIPVLATAACIVAGLALWVFELYRGPEERPRLIADSSLATATLVLGVALALLGAGFGLWLILIGAGIGALGLGGIVREQRARARTLRGQGEVG
jgi:hypothetical protein